MNIFKHNLASSKRHGLSVIEVLTSIVVALIGVFGVLAMIPFSVKQTQTGLDQDAATSLARSALSNFETSGYKIVSTTTVPATNNQLNWALLDGTRVTAAPGAVTGDLICIDPLAIAEGSPSTFPFNCNINAPELTMPPVTLIRPDQNPFSVADARRMFRLTDDLVFEESDDPTDQDADLNPPVQIFNEAAGGGFLNRQSVGAVSWCAVVQPVAHDPNAEEFDTYKFNVLVFKDRLLDASATMEAATVLAPAAGSTSSLLSNVTIPGALSTDVRRNDWVMLINRANAVGGTDSIARRTSMVFARITNLVSDNKNTVDPSDDTSTFTLDGPDFKFVNTTYVVYLRDVVAVYPRTIKLESSSEWNVTD